ncbi:MAG: hypothetical protein IPG92_16565 [Flavobacteriales bacterium]|nr:hypothetical protein [Flavobacteriales bacterium]
MKDRSSILPIGRTGDAAYWMYGSEGNFITSTWYMKSLPQWVIDFNNKKLAEQYLAQTWSLTLPVERYHQASGQQIRMRSHSTEGHRCFAPDRPRPLAAQGRCRS